ncbi:MAG: LuxR C-terminal-related transcriptional regulator [Nitrospirota bacterium]
MSLLSDDHKKLEIIDIAYSVPDRASMLQAVCEKLPSLLRISSAVLVPSDHRTGQFQFDQHFLFNGHPNHLRQHVDYYAALDPLADNGWILRYDNTATRYTDLVSISQVADSEFGRDFLARIPMLYCLCTTLGSQGDPIGAIGFHRRRQDGDFTDREKAIVEILAAHLARALRYGGLFDEQRHSEEIGVIVLRSDGHVFSINAEAMKALNGRHPTTIPDPRSSANAAFLRSERGTYRVRTIPIEWDSRTSENAVHSEHGSLESHLAQPDTVVRSDGTAKIILLEPLPPRWNLQQRLARFGLSARQEEVVVLVTRGCSNREIAERLFITEQTVKDHLHEIFQKAKVRRRSELIANILGVAGSA